MTKSTKQKAQRRQDQELMKEGAASAEADKDTSWNSAGVEKAVRWSEDIPEPKLENSSAASPEQQTEDYVDAVAQAPREEPATPTTTTIIEEDILRFWHMLPWMQRKEIAQQHGYHKIGDFEEYMSMQQALQEERELAANANATRNRKNADSFAAAAYDNALAYPELMFIENEQKPAAVERMEDEDEDAEFDNEDDAFQDINSENDETENEAGSDSLLLTFPDEILHKIFSFLPVTLYGTKLAYVTAHPHWKRLTRSEHTMKVLCERVYLQQARKKQLRVAKFQHSYRYMLYSRPRVQAGGGVYVLRFGRVKPIQRDMWTEVPPGAILETVYYRYLFFEENGSCLYALSTIPPHDMLKRFHRVLLESSQDVPPTSLAAQFSSARKKPSKRLTKAERERKAAELDTRVVWGNYTIQKDRVTVTAKQSWQTVQLVLKIITQKDDPPSDHFYLPGNQLPTNDSNPNPKASLSATKALSQDVVPRPSVATEEDEYVNAKSTYRVSPNGRFGVLRLEQHRSSASGSFDDQDLTYYDEENRAHVVHHSDVVNYDVEVNQVFRFVQDARF